jgi:pyruvate kinase
MDIQDQLKKDGFVKKGNIIINTASMPLKSKGKTNMLKIHIVE